MPIIDKVKNVKPSRKELIISKLLVIVGIYSAVVFLLWLFDSSIRRDNFLYIIILISFTYKVFVTLIEWLLIWHPSVPDKPKLKRKFTVDVLTTFVKGEPKELIKESLLAIKSITYPHESFLCDEADDPELKEFCAQHKIHHVTREKKIDAKAGNINNALRTVAKGEIVLILDPDHIAYPNFMDEVLPYFEDDEIGFVQVVQAYSNQYETIIAKAAAEQTYQFYGPAMMTLNSYGAVPAIGANCTFRRTALDSIGGHAPGLTEDMHTTLRLRAKGWKSVYNPVIVAEGLVPWNFSGYSLQQLKWSRGSFDLLFNVFPKVFKNLPWSQRFAFLVIPLFYLMGLLAFVDFLIPVIALLFCLIPINLNVLDFIIYYTQFYFISQVIRFYHQKWYYKEHEKGTAMLGGVLFKSTWWSTSLGFFYSLINKKVPYIPTPKDFRFETPWKLLIPNFSIIALSLFAIVYGLHHDFTPFSLFMAFLAFLNVLILSLGSLMAMQKQIIIVHKLFKGTFISKNSFTRKFLFKVKHTIYNFLSKNFVMIISLLGLVLFNIAIIKIAPSKLHHLANYGRFGLWVSEKLDPDPLIYEKKYGQFYVGTDNMEGFNYSKANVSFVKNEFYLNQCNEKSLNQFLDSCYLNNLLPFLSLSIDTSTIEQSDIFLTLESIYNEIKNRYMPVLIMFDRNLNMVSDDLYSEFHQQSYHMADSMAVNKIITWVWHSDSIEEDSYLIKSRSEMIDWVYAENETAVLSENYYYGKQITNLRLPLLINYSNIKEANSNGLDENTQISNVVGVLGAPPQSSNKLAYNLEEVFTRPDKQTGNRLSLPEYVKGVAYNPGRRGNNNKDLVVTTSKLRIDFEMIKEMGCNSIRRFEPSVYDYNILKTAKEFDLDIFYGFEFDYKIDYQEDSRRVSKYKREVLNKIQKYQSDTSIVSWGFGNETSHLLYMRFGQPYLSVVRASYLKFINELLKETKQIDKSRPVYIAEPLLSSSMYAHTEYVPGIDFYGINAYYGIGIEEVKDRARKNLSGIPYLLSEFGNKGYWTKELNRDLYNNALESSSTQKAEEYALCWNEYILPDSSNNLGGIAFCWQDKYEFTATWYGIVDIFDNKKPAYYALKEVYGADSQIDSSYKFPIPEYEIKAEYSTANNRTIKFEASGDINIQNNKFEFKWLIYNTITFFGSSGIFETIDETDFEYGKAEYSFTVPDSFEDYRIYLYVKDDSGNVITSNLPLISPEENRR